MLNLSLNHEDTIFSFGSQEEKYMCRKGEYVGEWKLSKVMVLIHAFSHQKICLFISCKRPLSPQAFYGSKNLGKCS